VYKHDHEPLPATSDVELAVIIDGPVPNSMVEPAAPLAQRKILHRGVILERLFWPLDGLRNIEAQLAGFGASTLYTSEVILDPTGEIARVQREVAAAYAKARWVRARCESAAAQATLYTDSVSGVTPNPLLTGYPSDWIQRVVALYFGAIVPALQMPCLANLDHFTFRKAFATARGLYESHGAVGLYRRILEILGSAEWTRDAAEARLEEFGWAFDCAVRVLRTRFYPDIDLQPFCRTLFVGGATDLVRSGFHRESACYFATRRSWYQNAIENDGSEEDRDAGSEGYDRLLAALGISGMSDLVARAEALRELLPDLQDLAEAVMAANSWIDRT
jgi:hypothetical protein